MGRAGCCVHMLQGGGDRKASSGPGHRRPGRTNAARRASRRRAGSSHPGHRPPLAPRPIARSRRARRHRSPPRPGSGPSAVQVEPDLAARPSASPRHPARPASPGPVTVSEKCAARPSGVKQIEFGMLIAGKQLTQFTPVPAPDRACALFGLLAHRAEPEPALPVGAAIVRPGCGVAGLGDRRLRSPVAKVEPEQADFAGDQKLVRD